MAKKMSKSQRFSKRAHEKKKRKEKNRTKKENEELKKKALQGKEKKIREELTKIMNEGRNKGVSYKKSEKNVTSRTQKNNISSMNSLLKELGIHDLKDLKKENVMNYLEQQKEEFLNGNAQKGGYINNKIKSLQRFYDSVKVSDGLDHNRKQIILKNLDFVPDLNDWKNDNKIIKSKNSSGYLKPDARQQKLINDRFHHLRKTRPDDDNIRISYDYHRFSSATGCRIDQGVHSTLNNLKKLNDGRYIFIVNEGEDKTNKPRIKIVENKHDINFLDRLVNKAKERSDKNGNAYLFRMKVDGDDLSREKIKYSIEQTYKQFFQKYRQTVQRNVRHQVKLYDVTQSFVAHSSRSIAIQKELKTRSIRYKRDPKRFYKDLQEMVDYDNSKNSFRRDSRGAIAYGYEKMRNKIGRELTAKEKAAYLTSCSAGHNRIDVMRDHYFSGEMNDWFRKKGIK